MQRLVLTWQKKKKQPNKQTNKQTKKNGLDRSREWREQKSKKNQGFKRALFSLIQSLFLLAGTPKFYLQNLREIYPDEMEESLRGLHVMFFS